MENPAPEEKIKWERISLVAMLVFGVVLLFLLHFSGIRESLSKSQHTTKSDLINTQEIATLSVSEFVYNGIARTYKANGDPDFNVLYRSTVKVNVDAENIKYSVDEDKKTVTFLFSDFTISNPVIDVSSIDIIPDRNDLFMDDVIALCRNDALEETKKSEKLMSSAKDNLKSTMEAWYSPVYEGYSFECQFGASEGGDAT